MILTNNTEQKTKELNELIDLAEKISLKIKALKDDLNRHYLIMFCSILVGSFVYNLIFNPTPLLSTNTFLISGICIVYFLVLLNVFLDIRKIKKEIASEYKILSQLYNMITVHKQGFSNELGILSNAIYEMRLSRIQFNFDNPTKNPIYKLISSILG